LCEKFGARFLGRFAVAGSKSRYLVSPLQFLSAADLFANPVISSAQWPFPVQDRPAVPDYYIIKNPPVEMLVIFFA